VEDSIDDLSSGRIESSLIFEITEVERDPNTSQTHIIKAKDTEGNDFRFEVWDEHLSYQGWREGEKYSVRESRVDEKWGRPVLGSTKDMEFERLDQGTQDSIVVMTDTHLGFRNREDPSLSEDRMDKVDCVEAFEVAVEKTLEISPDSVINAGDIFDDDVGEEDVERFGRCIDRLNDQGILFYYVGGNHNDSKGDRVLSKKDGCIDLNWKGKDVRNVVLYGVDEKHGAEKWLDGSPLRGIDKPHVGVFHHEIKDEKIKESDLDLVVQGHYHDGDKPENLATVGGDTLRLYPGSTESISVNYSSWEEQNPSIWELEFGGDDIDWTRHSLRERLEDRRGLS
jgi:DNA repair exonuclease SbcCD nuclease subunit